MPIPTPRSFTKLLGDQIDTFLSRTGLTGGMKTGSPVLHIMEANAQSVMRAAHDIFQMLQATDPDQTKGTALDRWGRSKGVPRRGATASNGYVTVTDSSFEKKATVIYQGKPQPIVGTTTLYVRDASEFGSAPFEVYLGRGTKNYEGPIEVSAAVDNSGYWTLTLSTPTQNPHNLNESVILAQGGNRTIPVGTVVQTKQGSTSEAVSFNVAKAVTILDGEVEAENVLVVCQKSGSIGRVPKNTLTQFQSAPFDGATVTNPLPFVNGDDVEDDDTYRERVKDIEASKEKGIPLAIRTSVVGIIASDENKAVRSASLVKKGDVTTLYIDDGTGYEEATAGVAIEKLVDSASGGEDFFALTYGHPVAKAFVKSKLSAPFTLSAGLVLAVKVGGVLSEHTFAADEFTNIASGTAFEVVASINGNPDLLFSARTADSGRYVVLFARADTNEDVEVVTPSEGDDANDYFDFPLGRVDTLRLYKNDRLLSKDGRTARITSAAQSAWETMTSGETLTIDVDGTGEVTYTFDDADFVDAETGYSTVAKDNSLESWCAVFEAKIPGISAIEQTNSFELVSNAGAVARASLRITGGTLVERGMFTATIGLEAEGAANDYTVDRNTGHVALSRALLSGETLTVGSTSTRAFVQTSKFSTLNLSADANLWFVVDGEADVLTTPLAATSSMSVSASLDMSSGVFDVVTFASTDGTAIFENAQRGDLMVVWDPAFNAANRGVWRITSVNGSGTQATVESRIGQCVAQGSLTTSKVGLVLVRTTGEIQQVTIPAASNYTPNTIVDEINDVLRGATASVYQSKTVRVYTNTFGSDGDIAVVAADENGKLVGFTLGDFVESLDSHLGSIESGNGEVGTPEAFKNTYATSVGASVFSMNDTTGRTQNSQILFTHTEDFYSTYEQRIGQNKGYSSIIDNVAAGVVTLRHLPKGSFVYSDRLVACTPYAIGPEDELAVVMDDDETSKRFVTKLYRKVKPQGSTYGTSGNVLLDADNSNAALGALWGGDFDWKDFAVYMKARALSHPTTTKGMLWRYYRHGKDGNYARLRYAYPESAAQALAVEHDSKSDEYINISVLLPSGAARTFPHIRNSTKMGVYQSSGFDPFSTGNNTYRFAYILGFSTTDAVRDASGNVTLTLDIATPGVSTHNIFGTFYLKSTHGPLASGSYTVTGWTSNTITFNDGTSGSAFAAVGASVGTVSNDTAEATFDGGGFVAGDIIYIDDDAGLDSNDGGSFYGRAYMLKALRVLTKGSQYIVCQSPTLQDDAGNVTMTYANAGYDAPAWRTLSNASSFHAYPLDTANCTITAIAAAVNAISGSPVSATAIGTGGVATGSVTLATWDEASILWPYYYSLVDGLNYVASTSYNSGTGQYTFTFKDTVDSALATESDWVNEDVRLVPVTAKSIAAFLESPAVGGLYNEGEILVSANARKVQIATSTPGSEGSVEVQSSSASVATATVVGSMGRVPSQAYGLLTIKASEALPFRSGNWVKLENANPAQKSLFNSTHALSSITASTRRFLFDNAVSGGKAWGFAGSSGGTGGVSYPNVQWAVEKHGNNVVAYHWTGWGQSPFNGLNAASENQQLRIETSPWTITDAERTGGNTVTLTLDIAAFSATSHGMIVGQSITVDVESDNFASGTYVITGVTADTVSYTEVGSNVTEGAIGTAHIDGELSGSNVGTFQIVRVDASGYTVWVQNPDAVEEVGFATAFFLEENALKAGDRISIGHTLWGTANKTTFTVEDIDLGNKWAFTVVETPTDNGSAAALGSSNAALTTVLSGAATSYIKQIRSISPDPDNATYSIVKVDSYAGSASQVLGTVMKALDKLAFPTGVYAGIDGYQYHTGLIGEANRVVYGDAQDETTYPAVAAAGSSININGPLVKRIKVSLALRVRTGVPRRDIEEKVRSVVAGAINSIGTGKSIPISKYVSAAQAVYGVEAVTPLSPTLTSANDVIAVQPQEKPLVLDPDVDISISFVGE